jgi:hypothetical protein
MYPAPQKFSNKDEDIYNNKNLQNLSLSAIIEVLWRVTLHTEYRHENICVKLNNVFIGSVHRTYRDIARFEIYLFCATELLHTKDKTTTILRNAHNHLLFDTDINSKTWTFNNIDMATSDLESFEFHSTNNIRNNS